MMDVDGVVYRHEFAVLNKSFARDLERSFNAYQSFERYFADKSAPFFIIVPEQDVQAFEGRFAEGIRNKDTLKMPVIVTEREILEQSGEPVEAALAMGGYYVQQIIKLCFGITGLARSYLVLDSDGYFTREFDPKYLFKDGVLQHSFHECWHRYRTPEEINSITEIGHGDKRLSAFGIKFFDACKVIRQVLGITSDRFSNYVAAPTALDSGVVRDLKRQLVHSGVNNFSYAIYLVPFEFQWYGEYLHAFRKVEPIPFLFHALDAWVDTLYVEKGFDQAPGKFGVQYPSYDYQKDKENPRIRPNIVYK